MHDLEQADQGDRHRRNKQLAPWKCQADGQTDQNESEGVLAIEMGATASDVKLTIHPHPTLSETVMESAEVFFGQATHVYKPKRTK